MEVLIIALIGFGGLAVLFSIAIADIRADAAHQRWVEQNNKRRFQLADAEKARAKAIRNAK